jgi:hypothetical protein
VKGFVLGLVAPLVMVFAAIIAIPDIIQVLRLRNMSRGTASHG